MIELVNVSKSYGDLIAVDDLSLKIEEGEICILLGKSGCGKSTTLRMINRLITPTKGEIYINGKNVKDYIVEDLRRGIGYVIQNVGLFPYMTVEKNISADSPPGHSAGGALLADSLGRTQPDRRAGDLHRREALVVADLLLAAVQLVSVHRAERPAGE